MSRFSKKYILQVLREALYMGTSPRKLAITCALGAVIGIFPVWGTTTWICLGLAILLRLNVVVIQIVNYLFFPIQLILIIPFIKAGTFIFNLQPFPYSRAELVEKSRLDFWGVVQEVGLSLGSGIAAWSILTVPLFLTVFYLSLYLFKRQAETLS